MSWRELYWLGMAFFLVGIICLMVGLVTWPGSAG